MSFCADIKAQLAGIRSPKRCKLPLIYGFLLFGRSFSYKRIGLQTASREAAEYYSALLKECFGAEARLKMSDGKRSTCCVTVPSDSDRLKILAAFDFGIYNGVVNRAVIDIPGGEAAFIRGAFLACGNVNNPEKGYRADFSVKDEAAAKELADILTENGIAAHMSKRAGGFCVYVGSSSEVTDLLTLLGVTERSLKLIETTIVKSLKNNMNRARNCDNANISKTVEASIAQRTAIAYLEKVGRLQTLDAPLYSAAALRMNNPDASLHELCRLSPEPITVSGLNHRLRRIMDIYNEVKK